MSIRSGSHSFFWVSPFTEYGVWSILDRGPGGGEARGVFRLSSTIHYYPLSGLLCSLLRVPRTLSRYIECILRNILRYKAQPWTAKLQEYNPNPPPKVSCLTFYPSIRYYYPPYIHSTEYSVCTPNFCQTKKPTGRPEKHPRRTGGSGPERLRLGEKQIRSRPVGSGSLSRSMYRSRLMFYFFYIHIFCRE